MSAKERLLSYLPPGQYDADKVMQAVFQTQGAEIDALMSTLDEILEQYFINRATWGLRLYEEQYGLPINEGLDPEVRRRLIMARKRRGRNGLLKILQALEPSLTLAWGRLIIPLTLESDEDIYNFPPLVALLERHKPAHLGYTFRVIPTAPESGYTVYANHFARNRLKLELLAGTAKAGRWPWWSTSGHVYFAGIGAKTILKQGYGIYDPCGTFYSGPVRDRVNVGQVLTKKTAIEAQAITGRGSAFPCGVYHCGEEVV